MTVSGWIGVDLDGTLAEYNGWDDGKIGKPIKRMVSRILWWTHEGITVKIVTARAADPEQVKKVKEWLAENRLPDMEVTDKKDFAMIELWDDRAIRVISNFGVISHQDEVDDFAHGK